MLHDMSQRQVCGLGGLCRELYGVSKTACYDRCSTFRLKRLLNDAVSFTANSSEFRYRCAL